MATKFCINYETREISSKGNTYEKYYIWEDDNAVV